MSENCDGSGLLEFTLESGYATQVACPGCPACTATPSLQDRQPDIEVEVGADTLVDLQRAWDTIRGAPGATMSSDVAWGLVTSYLPALLEMSRQWMLAQQDDPTKLRISAHEIFDSAH